MPDLCDNESNVYNYNRRRSLSFYKNALSNLFCITFDNSGAKGNFYTEVSLDETAIKLLFNSYIENEFFSIYYKSISQTGLILNKDKYSKGDYIRIHQNSTNPYFLEGKFFIKGSGLNGDCINNRVVKFMEDNPITNCGFKIVKFNI